MVGKKRIRIPVHYQKKVLLALFAGCCLLLLSEIRVSPSNNIKDPPSIIDYVKDVRASVIAYYDAIIGSGERALFDGEDDAPTATKLDMSHIKEMKDVKPVPFDKNKLKTILVWNNAYNNMKEGLKSSGDKEELHKVGCPQPNCVVTNDRTVLPVDQYDAIIFHYRDMSFSDWPKKRRSEQRYIFRELEPASYTSQSAADYNGIFNWTLTYRLDSDIPTPYGRIRKKTEAERRKYLEMETTPVFNKTKMAAWFVSNCDSASGRGVVAKNLKKHFPVDIYGQCGPLKCDHKKVNGKRFCHRHLEKNYKFYFSFENSLCKDYVTEKFFEVLDYRVIPVTFGSSDYKSIAPPHSFINVFDFPKVSKLAEYLKYLAENETAYNEYFEWKSDYELVDRYLNRASHMCHLCYKLHTDRRKKVYDNIEEWFITNSTCKHLKNKPKMTLSEMLHNKRNFPV